MKHVGMALDVAASTRAPGVPPELIRSRRRTLSVEVRPGPRLIVRAPQRCPDREIAAFLDARRDWIAHHLGRMQAREANRPPPPRYVTGESHAYLGEHHRLEVTAARRGAVTRGEGTLHVAAAGGEPQRVRRALEAWYRVRAREHFAAEVARCFPPFAGLGHAVPVLTVRTMTSRWGSLARGRSGLLGRRPARMTLNLALVRAPVECIEYVVVHELCHLEHRGHGRGFYALLERLMPDWRARKRRLEALHLLP